jgi:hypothetical protein
MGDRRSVRRRRRDMGGRRRDHGVSRLNVSGRRGDMSRRCHDGMCRFHVRRLRRDSVGWLHMWRGRNHRMRRWRRCDRMSQRRRGAAVRGRRNVGQGQRMRRLYDLLAEPRLMGRSAGRCNANDRRTVDVVDDNFGRTVVRRRSNDLDPNDLGVLTVVVVVVVNGVVHEPHLRSVIVTMRAIDKAPAAAGDGVRTRVEPLVESVAVLEEPVDEMELVEEFRLVRMEMRT